MASFLTSPVTRLLLASLMVVVWTGSVQGAATEETNFPPISVQHEVVSFGQDSKVLPGEVVSKVCTFWGDATVDGEVKDVVVVVGGNLKVSGKVRGTVVVVFGNVDASSTAVLRRPAIVVGGTITSEPGARIRADNLIVSLDRMSERFPMLRGVVSWVTLGAFYFRPLPPQVYWVWVVPFAVLLLYGLMSLVLPGPSESCVRALVERPITSYLLGLLLMCACMLALPFLIVLGVVGFGIGFFVILALTLVMLFGRMAVVRFVGFQLGRQFSQSFFEKPIFSLLLGAGVFSLIYTVPVIGGLVWAGVMPLAFGGLLMATYQAVRPSRVPAAGGPEVLEASAPPLASEMRGTSLLVGLPAGFFIRLVATMIDFILIGLISGMFELHGRAFLFAWVVYHVGMWSWSGSTLGGRVVGIRVVEMNGRPMTFPVALVRALAAFLSALPLCLGFFWAGWDRKKQSWHDKLTGTVMIWKRG